MNTEHWIRVRWESRTRYYEVHLHQDLWGQWILTRTWGGKGSQRGRIRHQPCSSRQEGERQLESIGRRRERHGYKRVLDTTVQDSRPLK